MLASSPWQRPDENRSCVQHLLSVVDIFTIFFGSEFWNIIPTIDDSLWTPLKHLTAHLYAAAAVSSVKLVVNAEMWSGDIIGIKEHRYGLPRVLCHQLLQSLC